jgi:peptidyl-prolyl cis-trans isomerase SurA
MRKLSLISLIIFFTQTCFSQVTKGESLDKVVAVVGKYMILQSDVKVQLSEARANGMATEENGDCIILEQLLFQKLLLAQADKDSVTCTDSEVENELNRRMNYYLQQFGSEDKMVEFYGKELSLLKEDFRKDIKELLIAQKMQQKIIGEAKATPAEVRSFYKSIDEDSLPLINSEVEIGQIIKKPLMSDKAKKDAREKISKFRNEILAGESFAVTATLYSEDPGSAKNGGEYDNIGRGQFVPEFESAAFRLKPGEVSEVVETVYGYHIIQLIARKGDLIDLRHILVSPKMTQEDLINCKKQLDTVYDLINGGKINFCEAASKYSDEKETKMNCGLMINSAAGNTRFEIEELGQMDEKLVFLLDKMNVGDVSKPLPYVTKDQKQAYRIFYLKNRISPHKANLKDDYQKMQQMAQMRKQNKNIQDWMSKKIKSTYIRVDSFYHLCKFTNNWLQTNN